MKSASRPPLIVGSKALSATTILSRSASCGWESLVVETLDEARRLLHESAFVILLAAEILPDGRGYDLRDAVADMSGTLLVGVELTEGCVWLPVLERGKNVFGQRALHEESLEAELWRLLRAPCEDNVHEIASSSRIAPAHPALHRTLSPGAKRHPRKVSSH
jgi:hypothetical protein